MGGQACWVLVIITLVLAVGPVRADQVYLLTSQMMNDEENWTGQQKYKYKYKTQMRNTNTKYKSKNTNLERQ